LKNGDSRAGPADAGHSSAPLFPLPGFYLYPGRVEGLHIFEPRYRRMVEDLLDRRGWLVIGAIQEGHEAEAAGAPPVYPVACLGEIVHHERLPEGRFLVSVAGLTRVRLREVPSSEPYRQVTYEPLPDVPAPTSEADQLSDRLRRALLLRSKTFLDLPPNLPTGALADLLLSTLELPVGRRQELFANPSVRERARGVLAELD
jgi:uncharacterized protein